MATRTTCNATRTVSATYATLIFALLLGSILAVGGGHDTSYAFGGDLDHSFGGGDGKVTTDLYYDIDTRGLNEAYATAVQADGKIVVVGKVPDNYDDFDFAVARYNPDGSLDTSFGHNGWTAGSRCTCDEAAYGVAIQPDGKIVVVGFVDWGTGHFRVQRFVPNGSLDGTFGNNGAVNIPFQFGPSPAYSVAKAVAIQTNGKIVVAGYARMSSTTKFAVARLNHDGNLDNGWDGDGRLITTFFGGVDEARAVAIQPDGKIVVAGNAQVNSFNYDFALARYTSTGSLDTTFGGDGKVTTDFFGGDDGAYAMALHPNGYIYAAGGFYSAGQGYDFGLARYHPNGNLDLAFDNDGVAAINFVAGTAEEVAYGVAVQPADGKVVAVGYAPVGVVNDFALVRLLYDGSLDPTFGSGGKMSHDFGGGVAIAYGVAIQADGKIVTAGTTYMGEPSSYDFALARYQSGNETPTPTRTPTITPTGTRTPTPTNTPIALTPTRTPTPRIVINEVDSDQVGSIDRAEFVELYDGGVGNTPLNGRFLVFYDGATDATYGGLFEEYVFGLDGLTTDGAGYFTIGSPGIPGVDMEFSHYSFIQNGADAVALYQGDYSQFLLGSPVVTINLLDAVVYDTGQPDDPGLLPLLNPGQPQVNENERGRSTLDSVGRCSNGSGGARNTETYRPLNPSPDGPNSCP